MNETPPFSGISSATIPYALETDWPVEAGGFEPLHFRIGIREDSQPGAAGLEPLHLDLQPLVEGIPRFQMNRGIREFRLD